MFLRQKDAAVSQLIFERILEKQVFMRMLLTSGFLSTPLWAAYTTLLASSMALLVAPRRRSSSMRYSFHAAILSL
jgi:hypothetical protein